MSPNIDNQSFIHSPDQIINTNIQLETNNNCKSPNSNESIRDDFENKQPSSLNKLKKKLSEQFDKNKLQNSPPQVNVEIALLKKEVFEESKDSYTKQNSVRKNKQNKTDKKESDIHV